MGVEQLLRNPTRQWQKRQVPTGAEPMVYDKGKGKDLDAKL